MRVLGHYVLGSRMRLFAAEHAAAGVLFLAAVASRGMSGSVAVGLAIGCALLLQTSLYLADLYEPADEPPAARWLAAAGVGVLLVTLFWRVTGGGAPGVVVGACGAVLVVFVLLRQIEVARPRRAIVYGTGARARAVAEIRESMVDCTILGYVADGWHEDGTPAPLPLLLDRSEIDEVAGHMQADLIVLASDGPVPEEALTRARLGGVRVMSPAGFVAQYARRLPPALLARGELALGEGFGAGVFTDAVQRVLDFAAAGLLLVLAAPILVLAAIAIRLDSRGPIFYSQERVGRNGLPYLITKLRTMRIDAETAGPVWASKNDNRVTRVGRFLRKARIDELPQIFAVLRGDMSMVGPRPERPYFVEQLKQQIPFYALREAVRPGVTGWAQIRYPYGASVEDARKKLEYDLYYIRQRSVFLNLNILFHTARTVLTGRGAL